MGLLLPDHIVEVIFSKLPISNLPVCRVVCRGWNDVVLNSKFLISKGFLIFIHTYDLDHIPDTNSKMHCVDTDTLSSVASFDFDAHDLGGILFGNSCNGLLFIVKSLAWCGGILNPSTNEFFKVPGLDDDGIYAFGFGFSPMTKKYKLFKVICETDNTCRMEVFRFSTQQWSLLPFTFPYGITNGTYFNGFIFWITDEHLIYALDVETERIESTVVLKLGCIVKYMKIEQLNGTIYAIFSSSYYAIQVWRMEGKQSWVRDFVVHHDYSFRKMHLVKAFEDGRMLALIDGSYFYLDKMRRKTIEMKSFDLKDESFVQSTCHISFFNFGSLSDILAGHE